MNIDSIPSYQTLLKNQFDERFSQSSQAGVSSERGASQDRFSQSEAPSSALYLYQGKNTEGMQAKLTTESDTFVSAPKISAKQASQNILGFVERRLMSEKAQGADDERLADLMAQAREGVEKGYEQARQDLESLGFMNDQLKDEIDQSYSLVSEGLNELEEKLFESLPNSGDQDKAPADSSEPSVVSGPSEASGRDTSASSVNVRSVEQYAAREERFSRSESVLRSNNADESAGTRSVRSVFEASGAYKSSSEFSLTTQDGDIVKISFSSMQAFRMATERNVGGMAEGFQAVSSSEFLLSISGELDEDELTAINDLLGQLSEVSDAFFSGDMAAAFESAMSLGFDGTEIAEFSLDLRQSQFEQAKAYTEAPAFFTPIEPKFQPLVAQVERLEQLNKLLDNFEYDRPSFSDMFKNMIQERGLIGEGAAQPYLDNISKFFERLV